MISNNDYDEIHDIKEERIAITKDIIADEQSAIINLILDALMRLSMNDYATFIKLYTKATGNYDYYSNIYRKFLNNKEITK